VDIWAGKTERRPLGGPRIILKCVFEGIGLECIDWMNLT
jgi:hypothetical protein